MDSPGLKVRKDSFRRGLTKREDEVTEWKVGRNEGLQSDGVKLGDYDQLLTTKRDPGTDRV